MRRARTAFIAFALVGTVVFTTTPAAARESGQISDPKLLSEIAAANAQRLEGGPEPTVTVELLTAGAATARQAVVAAGGQVTGEVPGYVVQARVPVSHVAELAAVPGVRYVQAPRRAGYITPPDRPTRLTSGPGLGTTGDEVAITNADEWQAAGYDGTDVKVGIVDFFDLDQWNTVDQIAENGAVPNAAHQFCQDSEVPPPSVFSYCNSNGTINSDNGDTHGVAVAEIVKDMAPGAELYIATVATVSDLQAAITWFSTNGVTIITRSLGSAYDGPGDGTGLLDAVVDYATSKGITWFNSAGNDGQDAYMVRSVPTNLGGNGYVDFDSGPGTDTWLRLDGSCILLDGIRWANDWYLPTGQKTDYLIEFWQPKTGLGDYSNFDDDHYNPTANVDAQHLDIDPDASGTQWELDANQRTGANPLEAEDTYFCPSNFLGPFFGVSFIRIKRNFNTLVGTTPDNMEIALAFGLLELDYYDTLGSAAKPVVDSKSVGLVAVGAVDPPAGTLIAGYSSQGPTTDGRIKPDVSAPSGFDSVAYGETFAGTSAASPVAAGMAAVLQSAGLAAPGGPTAALVKHFVTDLGPAGPDNAFGTGKILLPAVPGSPGVTTNAKYVPLESASRILDSRAAFHIGPAELVGPFDPETIVDLTVLNTGGVPASGVSAVVINLTSVNTSKTGYLQAFPYLRAAVGGTSTLNISTAGPARPNFAIVPVGVGGKISIYLHAGGNILVDVMGYFEDGQTTSTDGRFVALADPERWMDTRGINGAPLPDVFSGTPRLAAGGETLVVPTFATTAVPDTGVSALVVNVTAANATGTGYLRADPNGDAGPHSTVNYTTASASANTAIVPLSNGDQLFDGGEISVFASVGTNVIVDVVGYITDDTAAIASTGLFRPITPGRALDTRFPTANPFAAGESRTLGLTGLPEPAVPPGAAGVSANLTVVAPSASGYLKAYPNAEPGTSSLNFATGKTVANGALVGLSGTGTITLKMSAGGNVIVDVNGYFLA